MILQERTVGEVPGEDVEPGEGNQSRDASVEKSGDDDNEIEIRGLLVDFDLEVSDLSIHSFLKNFPLIILKLIFGDTAASEEDVDQPDSNGVEDEIVSEERRNISIPDTGE